MIALFIASAILLLLGIGMTIAFGCAFVSFSALGGGWAWGLSPGVIAGLAVIWLAFYIAPFTFHIGVVQ